MIYLFFELKRCSIILIKRSKMRTNDPIKHLCTFCSKWRLVGIYLKFNPYLTRHLITLNRIPWVTTPPVFLNFGFGLFVAVLYGCFHFIHRAVVQTRKTGFVINTLP